MRKKVADHLKRALAECLARQYPELQALDARRGGFNGSFGFRLRRVGDRSLFLVVTAHDEEDSFRTHVAWGTGDEYPDRPFRDLAAGIDEYLGSASAEVALALVTAGEVPYEFALDPAAAAGKAARDAIASRLQRGETVSPEEWLLTLAPGASSVDVAKSEVGRVCERILPALRSLESRLTRAG